MGQVFDCNNCGVNEKQPCKLERKSTECKAARAKWCRYQFEKANSLFALAIHGKTGADKEKIQIEMRPKLRKVVQDILDELGVDFQI